MFLPNPGIMAAGTQGRDLYKDARFVLDFAGVGNGGTPFYRMDSVTYASPSAMGFSGDGTFSSEGYTAATTGLSKSIALPADWAVLVRFQTPASPGGKGLFSHNTTVRKYLGTTTNGTNFQTIPTTPTSPLPKQAAVVGVTANTPRSSYDGAPVQTGTASTPATEAADFKIGAAFVGGIWNAPIALFCIFARALTDAEYSELSA